MQILWAASFCKLWWQKTKCRNSGSKNQQFDMIQSLNPYNQEITCCFCCWESWLCNHVSCLLHLMLSVPCRCTLVSYSPSTDWISFLRLMSCSAVSHVHFCLLSTVQCLFVVCTFLSIVSFSENLSNHMHARHKFIVLTDKGTHHLIYLCLIYI